MITSRIQMNMLFKNKYERKRKIYDRNLYNAMRIPTYIHETNKKFTVIIQPKQSCGF